MNTPVMPNIIYRVLDNNNNTIGNATDKKKEAFQIAKEFGLPCRVVKTFLAEEEVASCNCNEYRIMHNNKIHIFHSISAVVAYIEANLLGSEDLTLSIHRFSKVHRFDEISSSPFPAI